jgi:hypothetical protein
MARLRRVWLLVPAVAALLACPRRPNRLPDAVDAAMVDSGEARRSLPNGFLKGQLHAHSSGSADSQTPAAEVVRWYEERGYDFVVLTDHNIVTDTSDLSSARTRAFRGIELTRNLPSCRPPAPHGNACSLHVNALFVQTPPAGAGVRLDLGRPPSDARHDVYLDELRTAKAMRGVGMLCHPNLLYRGPDEATIHELAISGLALMEIRNEAWDSENDGDAEHPSAEALCDRVLGRGGRLFATATNDAHHYADAAKLRARGERPFDGDHGFIVVRASNRDEATIRGAIERGDFYASTGVVLERYDVTSQAMRLETRRGERVVFEVIRRGGVVARREDGDRLEVTLGAEDGPYLRVRVRRESDGAMAWTQPLFR